MLDAKGEPGGGERLDDWVCIQSVERVRKLLGWIGIVERVYKKYCGLTTSSGCY